MIRGGSAFVPWLGVLRTSFCGRCGSPVPDPKSEGPWFEVHAGVLDDDPGRRPERHILVEAKSPWFAITDELPQFDRPGIDALGSQMTDRSL